MLFSKHIYDLISKGEVKMAISSKKLFNRNTDFFLILGLSIIVILYHFTYIEATIMPQMGWWHYYAWRITEGDILYKDLFCFLPPYFVWFMSLLYRIFANHIFLYQLLGLLFRLIEVILVYKTLSRFFSPIKSVLCAYTGLVLTTAYSMDIPFDTNQLLRLLVVIASYFAFKSFYIGSIKKQTMYLCISGACIGIFFMSKQTGIILLVAALVGLGIIFIPFSSLSNYIKKAAYFVFGFIIACVPGFFYLCITNSLFDCINNIFVSSTVKGSISDIFIRVWQYQVHYPELLISLIILLWVYKEKLNANLKSIWQKNKNLILLLLTVLLSWRLNQISNSIQQRDMNIKYIFLLLIFYMCYVLISKFKLNISFKRNSIKAIFIFSALIVCIIVSFCCFFHVREAIYNTGIVAEIIRSICNIIFWTMLSVFVIEAIYLIKKKNGIIPISLFSFLGITISLILVSLISSVVEEIFMLPVAAMFFALILNRLNLTFLVNQLILGGSLLILIVAVITQKQISPYSWHGWQTPGINSEYTYNISKVHGLEGYIIEQETEMAFETIIDIINTQTTSQDKVYQFPHIPLFNVLTEREIGTYAVVHYFDVCPDSVAIDDAKLLYNDPPKIVIWCEFGDDLWNFHENYFRSGNPSGQRAIREFYNNYVQLNYTKVYEFKSISVWILNE